MDNESPSVEEIKNAVFSRVMEAVNEELNKAIDSAKEALVGEVKAEIQILKDSAQREITGLLETTSRKMEDLKSETLQEIRKASRSAESLAAKSQKDVSEAVSMGLEAGMSEITTTVEKYKRHIDRAGDLLSTVNGKLDALKKDIETPAKFVKDLVKLGYSPEVIEKQFRDRVRDISAIQGQLDRQNGKGRKGH